MRGILSDMFNLILTVRFNPAYAGNISVWTNHLLMLWVQPRVCGEYYYIYHNICTVPGSTPRMRGISCLCMILIASMRFNPAYAGNIIATFPVSRSNKVQPRVCGEYSEIGMLKRYHTGSTPRMRGISLMTIYLNLYLGFNPAYAGNINAKVQRQIWRKVQPRVCGEYQAI